MYEAHSNLYFAEFVQDGVTHRTLMDDFDWANMINLGFEMTNVTEANIVLETPNIPGSREV